MKNNVFFGIVWRIIFICGIGFCMSFVTPELRELFGDTARNQKENIFASSMVDDEWNWGARHYWYWWCCFLIFLTSLTNVTISIVTLIRKNYNTQNW